MDDPGLAGLVFFEGEAWQIGEDAAQGVGVGGQAGAMQKLGDGAFPGTSIFADDGRDRNVDFFQF